MDIFIPLLFIGILLIAAGVWHVDARHGKHHKITGPALVFLGLVITLPTVVPAGLLAANAVRCGHLPVVASSLTVGDVFSTPGQKQYFPDTNLFTTGYFCTSDQAIASGYTKDPLN